MMFTRQRELHKRHILYGILVNNHITLRQALEVFYAENAGNFPDLKPTERAKRFLRDHDVAHVVFGCDTSILGEARVKLWTITGTTLGFWKHFREYYEARAFELSRNYSWYHILPHIPMILVSIPQILVRARRMKRRWCFSSYQFYMEVPLEQIRKEFNIHPIGGAQGLLSV